MRGRSKGLILAILAVLFVSGCGQREEAARLTVYPVSGRLTVGGKPAEKAEISLRPVVPLDEPGKRPIMPYGIVQADGTFRIGMYTADDGVPPGDYVVTVIWPTITIEGGEEVKGPDRLHGFYNNPSRPVAKVTVKEGPNEMAPINLK
jgi:hypothetical protein